MLKQGRKWIAAALAVSLLSAAALGCGSGEGQSSSSAGSGQTSGNEENGTAASSEMDSAPDESEENAAAEDTAEVTMAFFTAVEPSQDELQAVEDAINAISESQINVHVDMLPIAIGNYDQQINLMVAGGEKLDLMATFFAGSSSFTSMQAQNQCMPLNDLMDEYGQDIAALFDEDIFDACSKDGELLGVPMYKDNVSNVYLSMRTDILEELGLTEKAQEIKSMADLEEIYTAVVENTDLIPIASSRAAGPLHAFNVLFTGSFEDGIVFSKMANDYIGTLSTDPDKVVNLYSTPEYKASVELVKDWYDKGFVYKDSETSTDSNYTQIASGKFFSTFFAAENATKISTIASCEYDMTTIELFSKPLESSSYNTNTWVIPVTAREPEAAMEFLNLMYTNKEIVDLLNYGIEGTDYVVKEDGTYGYPEGLDSTTVKYHIDMTWLFGNQYLAGVWEGDAPDTREISKEINEKAVRSENFGFASDVSQFGTEIAGITSAVNEFVGGLQNGTADVDASLEALNEKLTAAGMDTVVESVQQQFDQWKAGK